MAVHSFRAHHTQEEMNTNYDTSLCRTVFKEQLGEYSIRAMLSRFGGLAVFVDTADFRTVWQGDNIIDARLWLGRQPMAQHDAHVKEAIRSGHLGGF